jgi:serine phosphatase RsbU (regulator of sigma subunit)/pSer/pThr/pTyr-binding forkhead associated (FHA) protein
MEYLHVLKGANQGQSIPLGGKVRFVFGRSADCDLVINDPAVSRTHAQLVRLQGKLFLEDLKSRNSSFLNGQAVSTRTLLQHGDRITICDFVCAFLDDDKARLPVDAEQVEGLLLDDPETSSTIEVMVSDSTQKILESQTVATLNMLLGITTKLARTFQLHQLLSEILDSLFQLFKQADRGFVLLREGENAPLVPRMVRTRLARDTSTPRYSRRIVEHSLETKNAVLSKDAMNDPQFPSSDGGDSIAEARIRSVMCVPLLARDSNKPFGVIQLDTQERSKKFSAEDLKLLVAVASQAAVAIENARLYQDLRQKEQLERDMALARQVQLSILPEQLPSQPGYEFFAHYASALAVGGDYYDFVSWPDGRLAVMIGDVVGKGMSAALLMAKLSSDARYCLLAEADPRDSIARLNNLMQSDNRFITLLAAVLDPKEHIVTLVNAGHLMPLIYRRSTGMLKEAIGRDVGGLPVGIEKNVTYTSAQMKLEQGEGLVLFTDGVTDAEDKNGNQFRLKRVYEVLTNGTLVPHAMGERLVGAVKQFSLGCKQRDDITVVCFGRVEGP